ncbi:MAG: tRNA (N6-threonylcarbamoyladenosine(37)-N6)-methyltransferase TrmO [Candidatus Cloacimonetes bacterium]|nr:tRNA (N6-threonylcarbamoyladenosine(37)-N6)-methyltransferase TrmO [Candidatus Cloacimonadota bacterium]
MSQDNPETGRKIEYHPIGIIHTPFTELQEIPIQPRFAAGIKGTIEVFPEYREGLQDLEGFSHIILLYHLHRSNGYKLKVIPFLDDTERGLFATRAPRRPNPIGLSVVRLQGIREGVLQIENVDMMDGTPLLDIKPYIPEFDGREEIRIGWLESRKKRIPGKEV